jgi:hypothetical protein
MSQPGLKHMLLEVLHLSNNFIITWRKIRKTTMHMYKTANQNEAE